MKLAQGWTVFQIPSHRSALETPSVGAGCRYGCPDGDQRVAGRARSPWSPCERRRTLSLSHARNYSSLRNLNTREWRCNLRSSLHRGPCLLFIQRCTGSEIRAPRHAHSRLHRARLKCENKSTASFITARRRPLHRYMQQLVTCRKNKHANATKSYYMKRARD